MGMTVLSLTLLLIISLEKLSGYFCFKSLILMSIIMLLRERLSLQPLSLLLWTFPNPFVFNYLVTFYNTDILFVRKWSLGFIVFLFSFFVLAFVEGLLCQHYCGRLVICCHSSFIHHDRDLMRLHITIFDINYKYFCEKNLS